MFLFLVVVFFLTTLLIINPRKIFILFFGGLILFYFPFQQGLLFTVGGAKIYFGDLVLASLLFFLLLRLLVRGFANLPLHKSTILFLLFFIWGIVAVIRGIPSYSYSAVGEARWYIFPMIYYFFVITMFKNRQEIRYLINWVIKFIVIMVFFRFIEFFSFGGNEGLVGQASFRFLNSVEALLLSFLFVSIYLFFISGGIKKHKPTVILFLSTLFVVLIIGQVRSVWVAMSVGIIAAYILLKKISIRGIIISIGLLSLTLLVPIIGNFIDEDVYATLARSAIFLQNPREDPTGSWRLRGWRQNFEEAMKQPILGEGIGRYSEWFDGHKWQRVAVHNGYIMNFLKFGLVGFLLLFIGLFYWYAEMRRYVRVESDRYYKFMGYAIQICVITHLIYTLFYDFTIFFWILLAAGTILTLNYNYSHIVESYNQEALSK